MIGLRNAAGATHNIRMSEYPSPIPPGLPRRVIHTEIPIESCERCFERHDPRQDTFWPTDDVAPLPLPFNGQRPWEDPARGAATPTTTPITPITLEDF